MKKFWNGDTGLSAAYWVYGWLLPMGLALIFTIFGVTLVPGSGTARLVLLILCCYAVFWGVGTWRAASKYQGLKVWAVLAKVHIVAPLTVLVLAFAVMTIFEQQGHSVSSSANEQTNIAQVQSDLPQSANHQEKNECVTTIAEARVKIPELHGLDEVTAIQVLQRTYYPAMTIEQISALVCKTTNVVTDKSSRVVSTTQPPNQLANVQNEIPYSKESPATLLPLSKEKAAGPNWDFDDFLASGYRVTPKELPVLDYDKIMAGYGNDPAPKALGWLDKHRYESCQQDAANAPTSQGVTVSLRICREKFGQ